MRVHAAPEEEAEEENRYSRGRARAGDAFDEINAEEAR